MAASTTARADAVLKVRTILLARKAASPTLLKAVYNARPGSFPETPCVYIAGRGETVSYSAQTRERLFTGLEIVVVDALMDASEEADRMDVLVDLLVDDFWASTPFYSGGGQVLLASIDDADITLSGDKGTTTYRGAVLSFRNTFVREGRA